jgi:hypothetical protein
MERSESLISEFLIGAFLNHQRALIGAARPKSFYAPPALRLIKSSPISGGHTPDDIPAILK